MCFGISFFDFLEYLEIIPKTHPPKLNSREPEEKNRREQDYCSCWHYWILLLLYDESTHTLIHSKRYETFISTWKDKYGESVCVVWGGGGLKTHLLSLLGGRMSMSDRCTRRPAVTHTHTHIPHCIHATPRGFGTPVFLYSAMHNEL